jgi:pimeloyl-ACP methyl ester carboxylesterase
MLALCHSHTPHYRIALSRHQTASITRTGTPAGATEAPPLWPVFVANGDNDPMILPHYSYLLAGLIPQARVKIYPDSAHGFLFQHHAEFAADVIHFLS